MIKLRRTALAAIAGALLLPGVAACNMTGSPTCSTFVLTLDTNGKPGGGGKATQPKVKIKEPKKGSGGDIVIDADPEPVTVADDDCNDDD